MLLAKAVSHDYFKINSRVSLELFLRESEFLLKTKN